MPIFKELGSSVEKEIIKEGTYGRKPSLTWECEVSLEQIGDDKVVSEYLRNNMNHIIIGNGDEIADRIIETCVETMFETEESVFKVTKVDDGGVEFQIKITLISFLEKPYIFDWSDEDRMKVITTFKTQGMELFKEKKIKEAFYKFSKALKVLLTLDSYLESEEEEKDLIDLRVALYNNLSNCQLHYKNYDYVIELCTKSLDLKPNVKGYYRRALAYIEQIEYEKAENDLVSLLKLEPKNKQGLEKYHLVRDLDKSNRERYKATVKKMFSTT